MENIFWSIGIAGSIASLVGVLIASLGTTSKIIHIFYAITITVLAIFVYEYRSDLTEIRKAEKQAWRILDTYKKSTESGFVQASLAFLEKYQTKFPDTYERAKQMCKLHNCLDSRYREGINKYDHGAQLIDVSSSMRGLLRGIALIEKDS